METMEVTPEERQDILANRRQAKQHGDFWLTPEGRAIIRETWDNPEDGSIPLPLLNALEQLEAQIEDLKKDKPTPSEIPYTDLVFGRMPCGCPLRFPISHRPGCPEYRPPAVYPGTLEYILEAEKRMTEMLTGQSSRLSSRLRSGMECAPWVIEEVKVLEAQIESEKAGPAQEEYDQLDYECRQATYAYDRWKRYAKMLETELTAVKEDLNLLRAYREVLLDIAFGKSGGSCVGSVQSNPELNPSCMAYNMLGGRWDHGVRLDTRETITTLPKVASGELTVFGPGRINEKGQWEIPRNPTEED